MSITMWRMFRGLVWATLVCWLGTSAVYAQSSWLQAVSFGGSGNDFGYAVKPGSDGSQYFAGEFGSAVQFGSTQLLSFGGQDGFLAKRDPSGTVLWAVQVGGASDDRALGLALDGNDNIFLTGMLYDNATFGSTCRRMGTATPSFWRNTVPLACWLGCKQVSYRAAVAITGVTKWLSSRQRQYTWPP